MSNNNVGQFRSTWVVYAPLATLEAGLKNGGTVKVHKEKTDEDVDVEILAVIPFGTSKEGVAMGYGIQPTKAMKKAAESSQESPKSETPSNKRGPGRPKGSRNKSSQTVSEAVPAAMDIQALVAAAVASALQTRAADEALAEASKPIRIPTKGVKISK